MNLVRFQPRQGYNSPAREDAGHPYQPLSRLHNDIDRLFQGFFGDFPTPFGGLRDMFSTMPDFLPDRLEAGTHNMPGIAGLLAGLRYVRSRGTEAILRRERKPLRFHI